jgi:hypothetical protein
VSQLLPDAADVTVYENPVTCGQPTWGLVPQATNGFGCPACPHPTVETPLSTVLDRFPPDMHQQVLDSLTNAGPGGATMLAPPPAGPATTTTTTTTTATTSTPGVATWLTGAAAAVVLSVGVIATAVGVGGSDAGGFADHLGDPCPPAAARQVAGAAGPAVACSSLVTTPEGDRLQILDVVVPRRTALTFSYCNGLSCGDADPECYSNKWIPQFAGGVVGTLTLTPPPGAAAAEVVAGTGAAGGALRPLPTAVVPGPGGAVTVTSSSPLASELAKYARDGKQCGLSAGEHQAFLRRFGSSFESTDTEVVRVVVRWKGGTPGTTPQPPRLNGGIVLDG